MIDVLICPDPREQAEKSSCWLQESDPRIREIFVPFVEKTEGPELIQYADELHPMTGKKILFLICIGEDGVNLQWLQMLRILRREPNYLDGCVGAVIVDGRSEMYTKDVGRQLVFAANRSGCGFPGRPLVEGTGSLQNLRVTAKLQNCSLQEAYAFSIRDLIQRLDAYYEEGTRKKNGKLLVLHASIRSTSNTMRLWEKVRSHLNNSIEIQELNLRNGEILDCGGCPFTMCMHFSEKGQCYYGGVMVDRVYPAVEDCDAILLLCPNYNDSLSANLTAFINRLTALYRRRQFYEKKLFGIVVSGYSGGDILAMQLISALNMNKTFHLPSDFAMIETANDPGSIEQVEGIDERAKAFADRLNRQLLHIEE